MILRPADIVAAVAPHWVGALINMATTAVETERKAQIQREANAARMAAATQEGATRGAGSQSKASFAGTGIDKPVSQQGMGLGLSGQELSPDKQPIPWQPQKFGFSESGQAPDQKQAFGLGKTSLGDVVNEPYKDERSREEFEKEKLEADAKRFADEGESKSEEGGPDYAQYAGAAGNIASLFMNQGGGPTSSPLPQTQPYSFSPSAYKLMEQFRR